MFARALRPLILLLTAATATAEEKPRLTAADYAPVTLGSWSIQVEKSLDDHPRREQALALLAEKLAEVTRLVPGTALPELHKVTIWLSRSVNSGACYHPSRGWLEANGRVVEMARAIELQNIDHFIDWAATQPLMVLHELAHAWHDRVLTGGYQNPEILAAFKRAEQSGIYENIKHADGSQRRHYGLNNAMEYFAECSEAYFGRNDFEPFDRDALKAFDPSGLAMVENAWGITQPSAPPAE